MMTEKQFRLVNELGDYHIKDGDDELCYDLCSPSMAKENWNNVVNRLNELSEENQTLKERRHEDINELAVIAIKYNALKEENKELYILVETLKEQNQKFKARLNDLGVEYL